MRFLIPENHFPPRFDDPAAAERFLWGGAEVPIRPMILGKDGRYRRNPAWENARFEINVFHDEKAKPKPKKKRR